MYFDLSALSPNKVYYTLIQTLVPRPVAWVLSENQSGNYNLAPFSYFSGVASDPPLVMISVGKKPNGDIKDTRANIIEREHFVIHIPHREMAQAVTATSKSLAAGDSELDLVALDTCDFEGFSLPRLTDCRVAFACERYRIDDITATQTMIIGRVSCIYVADSVITTDENQRSKIHADKIDPISRIGGDEYGLFGGVISVPRPK